MTRILLFVSILFFVFPAQAQPPAGAVSRPDVARSRLQGEISSAAALAGGTVGVSAVHIESGRRIAYHAGERFPMASTYKVPIAVQLLTRADRGEISLEEIIELKPADLHPESGILTPYFKKPGVKIPVQNLLELMLVLSDNSAADLILRLAGGPEQVTARLKTMGIAEMEVHRSTVHLIADWAGYTLPPEADWTPDLFERLPKTVTPESRRAAARNFAADRRDTSSPEAMSTLLERIFTGRILREESGRMLLEILERCQTGKNRIKGLLPPGTPVAHKSGTLGGTTNDAGIITLPHQAGHIALAVFVKSSDKEAAQREMAIAHIARSIYDFFLFQP
jgi:beta-lactamase class A